MGSQLVLLVAGVIGVMVVSLWKAREAWEDDRLSLMWAWLITGLVISGVLAAAIWLALNPEVLKR